MTPVTLLLLLALTTVVLHQVQVPQHWALVIVVAVIMVATTLLPSLVCIIDVDLSAHAMSDMGP